MLSRIEAFDLSCSKTSFNESSGEFHPHKKISIYSTSFSNSYKCNYTRLTTLLEKFASKGEPRFDVTVYKFIDSSFVLPKTILRDNELFKEGIFHVGAFFVNGYWIGQFVNGNPGMYAQVGPNAAIMKLV